MAKRINVDWENGGYLDVSAWVTRDPAPGKLWEVDVEHVNSVGDQATIEVPAGTEGQIEFFIKIAYEIKPDTIWAIKYFFYRPSGTQKYRLTWDYKCTPDGQLILTRNRTGHQTWSGYVNMKLSASDLTAATATYGLPYVEVFAEFSYAEGDDGTIELGIDPLTFSKPKHAPRSSGAEAGMRINFNITGKRELVIRSEDKTIYFEREGQPDLDLNVTSGNRIQDLQDWVDRLQKTSPEMFEALSKRYFPIHLKGFASKTDNETKNFELSDTRVQNVQRRLDKMLGKKFGKDIWFDSVPRGKRDAKGPDNVPAAKRDHTYLNDRRVEIHIDAGEALKGIRDMRAGRPPASA